MNVFFLYYDKKTLTWSDDMGIHFNLDICYLHIFDQSDILFDIWGWTMSHPFAEIQNLTFIFEEIQLE